MNADHFSSLCLKYSKELICLHEPNGIYVNISPSSEKIIGYTPKDLMGKNPYEYFHADDKEYIEEKGHLPSLKGKSNLINQYRFLAKNGKYIWLETETIPLKDNDDNVEFLLTVSKDVSEIREKLDSLYKDEILWEEAGRLALLGAWEIDLETMTPLWSKTTYDIHEVPYEEQPKLDEAINFYAEEVRPEVEKMVQDAIELGKSWDKQMPFITAKGRKTWVRSIGRPEIRRGKTVKLYGVFQDISKEVEARNQQKKLIDQLTNQKSQLQEFSQIVSHNIRSPVSSISTLIQFLETADNDAERKEIIDNIKQVNTSLNSLLSDLVDAVKIISNSTVEYETIYLKKAINKALKLLDGSIKERSAKINIDTSAWQQLDYPRLYFDSILLNLISNSLKYYAENRPLEITIKTTVNGNRKALLISDNGLGIDLKRHGRKVFKLHKTFHRKRPGKGLGLFMVKNQVEATGSKIEIDSEEGRGTTFTITFMNEKV